MSRRKQRSLSAVPRWIVLLLVGSIVTQLGFQTRLAEFEIRPQNLPSPPSEAVITVASLDSRVFAAQMLMLWLQSFDLQPGVSLSFKSLDYDRLTAWLATLLRLHPQGQYPLLSAARVYAEVQDPPRQRKMLSFVADEFERDPVNRWPWLAHAVYIAKHRLKDINFALALAERLAAYPDITEIPPWARQMNIFVLEEMGELQSAKVLLGGLLDSGKITDPHEQWFLSKRFAELEKKLAASEQ
ncbi:MAG: hypothetical protein ACU84Q_00025 [Gammaproteobacteria bacterium]